MCVHVLVVLHDHHLTHTDLKPENILFTNSDFDFVYNEKRVSLLFFVTSFPYLPSSTGDISLTGSDLRFGCQS